MDDLIRDFMAMAEDGDVEGVKRHLLGHVNVNMRDGQFNDKTALMSAASRGQIGVMELLLDHNAGLELTDKEGMNALGYAIEYSRVDAVRFLLERGADPNAVVDSASKWTVLMNAANNGDADIVELLLKHGADPNAVDNLGETAYAYAVATGHLEVAKLLPDPKAISGMLSDGQEAIARLRRGISNFKQTAK